MQQNHNPRRTFAVSSFAITALALSTIAASASDLPGAKPADMTKPVQVFILMGQSNMVGLGKVGGPDGSLARVCRNRPGGAFWAAGGEWGTQKIFR